MINKEQVFPFKIHAFDTGNFVQNPKLAEIIWHRVRPKGLIWYALDIEVLDEDRVKLSVHNMRDSFHGGIGDVIHAEIYSVESEEEREQMDEYIQRECTKHAILSIEAEEENERQQRVLRRRREMFGI